MTTYLSKDSLGCDCHYYWFLLQCSVIFQHKSLPPPQTKKERFSLSVRCTSSRLPVLSQVAKAACAPAPASCIDLTPATSCVACCGSAEAPAGGRVSQACWRAGDPQSHCVSGASSRGLFAEDTCVHGALLFFFFSFREMDTN